MLKKVKRSLISRVLKKKFKKKELFFIVIKNLVILNSFIESEATNQAYHNELSKQAINSTFKNACIYSGRTNGYFRMFQMSRFFVKSLVSQKLLSGIYKANF
jgi:ribosomal protein S14